MPYWRLSGFYLFYFAALGGLLPYWGLYLKSLGFNAVAIGELMAIPMATKFLAPYVWGWLGDHLGRRMVIVRLGSLLTAVIFLAVFQLQGFWELGLAMVLFSFFWNAVLPQFETVVLDYLGDGVSRYARIRLWGSIGFILSVIALGIAVDLQGPLVILPTLFCLYGAIWISSLLIRDPAVRPRPQQQAPIIEVLKQPAVIAFFAVCFLLQASHGPYYGFYSIHLEAIGYSKTLIGLLWALGVVAEVIIFFFMHRLLQGYGARKVLLASLFLTLLRWLIIGHFADSLEALIPAQLLHAASYGSFHAAAIHIVHHYFTGKHQGRGQALYSSLSFGLGGALGTLVSGFVWDDVGPSAAFTVAAMVSAAALLVAWRWPINEIEVK
ncbi:MAG: MFS transporter [Sedimenticola sp.]